mmetsp:Transcript_33782/g.99550  ORF Transcript_33782/g.99550 Transcript_33782/m.99550 type:complete len:81 (-) Transcript_33782:30-272(-)
MRNGVFRVPCGGARERLSTLTCYANRSSTSRCRRRLVSSRHFLLNPFRDANTERTATAGCAIDGAVSAGTSTSSDLAHQW